MEYKQFHYDKMIKVYWYPNHIYLVKTKKDKYIRSQSREYPLIYVWNIGNKKIDNGSILEQKNRKECIHINTELFLIQTENNNNKNNLIVFEYTKENLTYQMAANSQKLYNIKYMENNIQFSESIKPYDDPNAKWNIFYLLYFRKGMDLLFLEEYDISKQGGV